MGEITYRKPEEMKDSGVDWLGMIPREWKIKKIKFIADIYGRIGFRGYTTEDIVDQGQGAITLSPANIEENKLILRNNTYISWRKYKESPEIQIKNGDVLFVKTASIGKTAYVEFLEEPATINPQFVVFKKVKINNKLLYYFLLSNIVQNQVHYLSNGGVLSTLTQKDIGSFYLANSSIKEQRSITNFLDTKSAQFDSIIAEKEQLIANLEEAKKSLTSEVVTGKVKIVDGQLVKRQPEEMKDSGLEWLGMIPRDWMVKKLKYIGEAITGLTYSPNDIVDEAGIMVLRSSNVQSGKIVFNDNVYVNKKIPRKLRTRKGDILMCSRNGSRNLIGKNAVVDEFSEDNSFGAFMTVFRSEMWRFLSYVFNSTLFDYQSSSFLTSTINQLTINNLNNFLIALPCEKEQLAISNYLDKETKVMEDAVLKIIAQIQKLKEAKQSLISESVTGKIDLRDWAISEEGART